MEKRQSELVNELCSLRGEGVRDKDKSSFSSRDFGGHVFVSLWRTDTEGNVKEEYSESYRVFFFK